MFVFIVVVSMMAMLCKKGTNYCDWVRIIVCLWLFAFYCIVFTFYCIMYVLFYVCVLLYCVVYVLLYCVVLLYSVALSFFSVLGRVGLLPLGAILLEYFHFQLHVLSSFIRNVMMENVQNMCQYKNTVL
jgi:hypothetical protein